MKAFIKTWIANKAFVVGVFCFIAIVISIQALVMEKRATIEGGNEYNRYNNYTIYKNSFYHLKEGKNLYVLYPEKQWDIYKYTPTFSAVFAVFAIFPDWIGLNLWNLTNVLLLVFGVYSLPKFSRLEKGVILLIGVLELMTSMQNEQSNGLMAGLFVMAFALLERKNYLFATLCIVFSVFIKLFGIVGFALYLLYKKKWKLFVFSLMWFLLLAAIPFLFVTFEEYWSLLESYIEMLSNDHSNSYGYSIFGIIHSWFNLEDFCKLLIVIFGAVLFLIPFTKTRNYKDIYFRLLALASVMLWVIVFNHKAESPTFIIAMTGVGIWFMNGVKSKLDYALLILAIVLTSLSSTDLFPQYVRTHFIKPYYLKGLPAILIWIKVVYEMLIRPEKSTSKFQKVN